MKNFLNRKYTSITDYNCCNILSLLDKNDNAVVLDLGCDDGVWTSNIAQKVNTKKVYGVEIVEERIIQAENMDIIVKKFDLNGKFDFPDNFFDVIHANQVIEHLYNSDNFLSEIYRVLKFGGYAVISTENASSWHNIFASIMGWQIFSLTNISNKKKGIGNPLAIHRGDKVDFESWNHIRIYNIYGLKELFEVHGFKVEAIKGAGYFPLPKIFGNFDKTHCHYMTFKIRK